MGIAYDTAQGRFDFHALRVSFCTAIGQSGASVETVRTLARHASITTTQRYLKTDDDQQAAALAALPVVAPIAEQQAATGTEGGKVTALVTGSGRETSRQPAPLCAAGMTADQRGGIVGAKENPVKHGVSGPMAGEAERGGFVKAILGNSLKFFNSRLCRNILSIGKPEIHIIVYFQGRTVTDAWGLARGPSAFAQNTGLRPIEGVTLASSL
ncbi:tyrosine-type recombinase/integrase [Phycisphaerales bacterium AB-hyl4]|uniref:Tyrosine-type recombinase/integrase n=1 Tax=Natronomicrosphaera hydrolytica TaxID=3242702 RepID=A0ABV4U5C2_9BACT